MAEEYVLYPYELYHHGVKGMRWGVRRSQKELDRLSGRIKEREAERKRVKESSQDGVLTKKYRNLSKKIFFDKERKRYIESKLDENASKADRMVAEARYNSIKNMKRAHRQGHMSVAEYMNGEQRRSAYGYNLTKNEREAIYMLEIKDFRATQAVKSVVKKAAPVVAVTAAVAVGVGAAWVKSKMNSKRSNKSSSSNSSNDSYQPKGGRWDSYRSAYIYD